MLFLYHGTTTKYLPEIMQKGLLPRSKTGVETNWPGLPSKKDFTYLSSGFAFAYACKAVSEEGEYPVVVRAKVEPDELFPDEDFIGICLKRGEGIDVVRETIQSVDIRSYSPETALQSLEYLGTCACEGIEAKRLAGWVIVKNKYLVQEGTLTDVNLGHWQFRKTRLKAMHKYLFGLGEYPIDEGTKMMLNSSALSLEQVGSFKAILKSLTERDGVERYDKRGRRLQ